MGLGFGFTFLTPLDALFALAAVIPLAALWLAQTRMESIRRVFSLATPRRRELAGVVAALALLPVLMGVAAAQPVVVRHHLLGQRQDVQVFFVIDTSASMRARTGPHGPTRLSRAKREAEEVIPKLGDIPVGLAAMTDRVLPVVMPTPNYGLVRRTLEQSVGINEPPRARSTRAARPPSRRSFRCRTPTSTAPAYDIRSSSSSPTARRFPSARRSATTSPAQ